MISLTADGVHDGGKERARRRKGSGGGCTMAEMEISRDTKDDGGYSVRCVRVGDI